ncbi:MAG: PAS domain S-box protein [Nitrospirae bacterium]|nr:PAS domain S-box protein [Nitrospirota bacterium]
MKSNVFKNGIKRRIVLHLFLAGVLPLVLGMVLTYTYGTGTFRDTVGESFQRTAYETATRTDWVIQKEIQRLRDLSVSPDIRALLSGAEERYRGTSGTSAASSIPERERQWMKKVSSLEREILDQPVSRHLHAIVLENRETLMGTLITDAEGGLLAASTRPKQFDFRTARWWREVREGKKGDVYVSWLIDKNGSFETDVETIDIVITLRDPATGKFQGVIKMCYNFKALFSMITSIKIGETGHAMLVDSEGTPLFCSLLPPVAHTIRDSLIRAVTSNAPGWAEAADDAHGGKGSIIGFAPVAELNRLSPDGEGSRKWHIFLRQSPEETYAQVYSLLWKVGTLGLILVVFLGFSGLYAGERIVAPLQTLRRAVREMGEGSLEPHVEIRTRDEIQELYQEFIQMAKKVKGSQESLLVFLSALNYATDAVVITRKDGTIDYVNPAFTELTGYTAEEAIGNTPRILKSGKVDPAVYKVMWDLVLSGKGWKGEVINRKKDGALFDSEVTISPIIGPQGEIINLVGISRDITQRKGMEAARRRYGGRLETLVQERTGEIAEAKAYLENLLENANDIIYTLDPEGRFTYINPKIEEWGYRRDQLPGRPFLSILSSKHYGKRFRQCIREKVKLVYEVEGVTADGKGSRQALISISPLFSAQGEVNGVLGIVRDITERKKLEAKLIESEKMTALGQMATMIAHEIRNPLSSIKMNLQILSKRIRPRGELKEHFSIALEEVGRLEELLRSILDYAKPPKLELSWEDIHEVLEEGLILAVKECRDKRITVLKDYAQGVPRILIDRGRLKQAVLNLYLNAVHAMTFLGELHIRTAVLLEEGDKGWVEVEIADAGKGIPEKDIPRIFDPFFTSRSDGTGLGLTIVKRIVEEHRGEIGVRSAEGKGTRVTIRLPMG